MFVFKQRIIQTLDSTSTKENVANTKKIYKKSTIVIEESVIKM